MNEEVDEAHFYHQDFTTASEWEMFTARLEEIIQEWKLPHVKKGLPLSQNELSTNTWKTCNENVQFADVEFTLKRYVLKVPGVESPLEIEDEENSSQVLEDLMSTDNDFCILDETSPIVHPLARWYGLRDFVVLAPSRNIAVDNESKIKILLSSANIAVANSNCEVPVFVKILEPNQHVYVGVSETRGLRTNFDMIHLKRTPLHCKYLTGLLDLFKGKIAVNLTEPVNVSVRLTYSLQDWTTSMWCQEPPDFDLLQGEALGLRDLGTLPFGATFDPVSELLLFCSWPQLPENVAIDSQSYSDFDPKQAPEWSVRVRMAERPVCLLSECLSETLQLLGNHSNMRDILGAMVQLENVPNPFGKLTESPLPTLSSVLSAAKSHAKSNAPLQGDLLMTLLYHLFPDAQDNHPSPYDIDGLESQAYADQCRTIKSSPSHGLVWRLGVLLALAGHWLGGARSVAYLWYEFTQEMRYRTERNISIPGLGAGFPDPRTCLLHQKLQMLNCCIERKRAREEMAKTASHGVSVGKGSQGDSVTSESEEEEEEFYDCDEDADETNTNVPRRRPKANLHSLWNQPVGRLSRFGSALLVETGEHMYVPMTQEPVPKTEDQLEDDAEVMLQLGTDAHGSELRARMMSASLLSDMESFKAANPGGVLEDFIKWYSPRDWIETDELDEFGQKKGHLSARMKIPGNTWVSVWESAKPVPARRQKRLFDDTKEAEKVLHFLECRTLSQIVELILPSLFHSAICRLLEESEACPELKDVEEVVHNICSVAGKLSRCYSGACDNRTYENLCSEIGALEASVAQCRSLRVKFAALDQQDVSSFVSGLLGGTEVSLPGGAGGPLGLRVGQMFSEARRATQLIGDLDVDDSQAQNTSFAPPIERQFVLRVRCPRPTALATPSSQFMRAVLRREDFRLAGAFTMDTIFV